MSACDCASTLSIDESCLGNAVARGRPCGRRIEPGAQIVLAGVVGGQVGPEDGGLERVGSGPRVAEQSADAAGPAKRRPQTIEETGLPGRPSRSMRSEPAVHQRLSGPHGHAPEAELMPWRASADWTRSWSPTEAPPSVTSRSAPARAARPRCRAPASANVSRAMPRSTASPPACSTSAASGERIGGDDLVGAGRPRRGARARRRSPEWPRAACAGRSAARGPPPRRARGGAHRGAGPPPEGRSPAVKSSPLGRTNLAGAAALADHDARRPPPRRSPGSTMASAPSGSGAPVKIRTASPGPTAPRKPRPAALAPITRKRAGRRGDIGGAHGVAVHGGGGEGRLRPQRRDVARRACARRRHASGTVLGRERLPRSPARGASASSTGEQAHGAVRPRTGPERPPLLRSSRTPSIRMPRSAAFTMS